MKNYLRKVYDKLGVADRLELALFCLNSKVLQEAKPAPGTEQAEQANEPEPANHSPEKIS